MPSQTHQRSGRDGRSKPDGGGVNSDISAAAAQAPTSPENSETNARELTREAGVVSLWSRGSELEREFSFGVVRQLFQGHLRSLDESRRTEALAGAAEVAGPLLGLEGALAAPGSADPSQPLHALHWLSANLALRHPLALFVDDAHWADEPSLHFLHYLSGRIEELPLLVLLSARTTQPEAPVARLEAMRDEASFTEVHPSVLTEDAGIELFETVLEASPDPEFARACCHASGGNPFLLTELARAVDARGIAPTAEDAGRIGEITPASVSRSVLGRLARLKEPARGLAQSAAILGDGAELAHAGELAGLDLEISLVCGDALIESGILRALRPVEFAHPLIRAAVYDDLAAGQKAARHAHAAQLLDRLGQEPDAVAGHLLRSEPEESEWAVAVLRQAADRALKRGTPEAAVDYLHRALREPPPGDRALEVRRELGSALLRAGNSDGLEILLAVRESVPDPEIRADLAMEVGMSLWARGRGPEALRLFDSALSELGPKHRDQELRLKGEAAAAAVIAGIPEGASHLDSVAALELDGDSFEARRCLDVKAFVLALGRGTPAAAREAAAAVILDDAAYAESISRGAPAVLAVVATCLAGDNDDLALARFEEAIEAARRLGGVNLGVVNGLAARAFIRETRGELAEAEADARLALAAMHETLSLAPVVGATAVLSTVALEKGIRAPRSGFWRNRAMTPSTLRAPGDGSCVCGAGVCDSPSGIPKRLSRISPASAANVRRFPYTAS